MHHSPPSFVSSRTFTPLSSTELRRRAWHIAPGLLPAVLWFIPHADPLRTFGWAILLVLTTGFGIHAYIRYRQIARPGDQERLGAVLGYSGSVLACLVVFPGDIEIALTVLAIIAFGDGWATAGGLLIGGRPLPWNPRKTWAGLVCFLAGATPIATLVYWGETAFNPASTPQSVDPFEALVIAGTAVAVAGIAESIPSRVNDNIRVGLTAAVVVSLLHGLLIGWQF